MTSLIYSYCHFQISSPLAEDEWIPALSTNGPPSEKSDLGRHLSCLHTILFENISKIPESGNPKAERLRKLLDEINTVLHRPTLPLLKQISQTTIETVERQKSRDGADSSLRNSRDGNGSMGGSDVKSANKSSEKSFTGIKSLINGTLGRDKRDKAEKSASAINTLGSNTQRQSHPAPHHRDESKQMYPPTSANPQIISSTMRQSSGGASSVIDGVSFSDDTSSSSINSLTASPGAPQHYATTARIQSYQTAKGLIGNGRNRSTISLNETDSSDDSTYSSQVRLRCS